jgi:hypothetical protein
VICRGEKDGRKVIGVNVLVAKEKGRKVTRQRNKAGRGEEKSEVGQGKIVKREDKKGRERKMDGKD